MYLVHVHYSSALYSTFKHRTVRYKTVIIVQFSNFFCFLPGILSLCRRTALVFFITSGVQCFVLLSNHSNPSSTPLPSDTSASKYPNLNPSSARSFLPDIIRSRARLYPTRFTSNPPPPNPVHKPIFIQIKT